MVENLPKEAIKVFCEGSNGKSEVISNVSPREAFYQIGHSLPDKINIVVEDELAKKIVTAVAETAGSAYNSQFNLTYLPGGASNIKRNITVYSNEDSVKRFILFDGDQKPAVPICVLEDLRQADVTKNNLQQIIDIQCGQAIKFFPNGGGDISDSSEVLLMKKFLVFYKKNVSFLPFTTPEELLWDDAIASGLYTTFSVKSDVQEQISKCENKKEKFEKLAEALTHGENGSIKTLQSAFLQAWIRKEDSYFLAIKTTLDAIRDQFSNLS